MAFTIRHMALAAALGLAGAGFPGELSIAERTVRLNLSVARTGVACEEIPSLTYSGTGWASPSGGSATVTASKEDGSPVLTLVEGKAGEGYFAFTPLSAGVWVLYHTSADGTVETVRYTVSDDGSAGGSGAVSRQVVGVASGTVGLNLVAGTREYTADAAKSLTYSGTGWASPEGEGSATVVAELEDGALPLVSRLLDSAKGEGTFTFSPISGGTWLLKHTSEDGSTATARFSVASDEGAETRIILGGDAAMVALDLVAGVRELANAADIKPITYSASNWRRPSGETSTGVALVTFSPETGEAVARSLADEGTYEFVPAEAGLWTLTHVAEDGTAVTAQFNLAVEALKGTLQNPYDIATNEELAEVARDGVYVRIPAGTVLDAPEGLALVAVGGDVWRVESVDLPAAAARIAISGFEAGDAAAGIWILRVTATEMRRGDASAWVARMTGTASGSVRIRAATTLENMAKNDLVDVDAEVLASGEGDAEGEIRISITLGEEALESGSLFIKAIVTEEDE